MQLGIILLPIFIGLLVVYLLLGIFAWKVSPTGIGKVIVIVTFLALPILVPNIYRLSPAYFGFLKLCDADDRKLINKVQPVEYMFIQEHNCGKYLEYLDGYQGYECSGSVRRNNNWINENYRFAKSQDWDSCFAGCGSLPRVSEQKACWVSCLEKTIIKSISNIYSYDISSGWVEEGKISFSKSTYTQGTEVLATSSNYRFYPYGNKSARILGASSGSAPTIECAERVFVKDTDVFIPK